MSTGKTVVFLHPDLGIGGAERLVIDAAVGLQNRGHKIVIFTSHCDPSHCFDEARDGTLEIHVRGNTIIPPNFLGRFSVLCAILRQLHLVLQIALFTSELQNINPDLFFIDQLSACVPLLRVLSSKTKILFYCHFPDKLLARKGGWWKTLYRLPFDWLEQWSTGASDGIVVNSKFTRGIFADAFPALRHRRPGVVYPCVNTEASPNDSRSQAGPMNSEPDQPIWKDQKVLLSINRFERKKDIGLAIRAYAGLDYPTRTGARLVIAGGYDPRVSENVSYHKELEQLANSLNLRFATARNIVTAMSVPAEIQVLFLQSIPASLKSTLLLNARLLVYTPGFEHFGIVPLEAMLAQVPVLAADRGGPTETVVDNETGWLRSVENVHDWTAVMQLVLAVKKAEELRRMGQRGSQRVKKEFSQRKMAERLEEELRNLTRRSGRPPILPGSSFLALSALCSLLLLASLFVVIPSSSEEL